MIDMASPQGNSPSHPFGIIVMDGVFASCLSSFLDVLGLANAVLARDMDAGSKSEPATRAINATLLSPTGAPITTRDGQSIIPDSVMGNGAYYRCIFVPDSELADSASVSDWLRERQSVVEFLETQWAAGAVIAAVSSGVLLLAATGLLDGRLATTSSQYEREVRRRFPLVDLDVSQSITEVDNLFCGATLNTTMRLSCQLLELIVGGQVANSIAQKVLGYGETSREVVMGSQTEWISHGDLLVSRAQEWLARNYSRKVKIDDLTDSLAVSERTLFRRFKQALGMTPHVYLRQLRIAAVKRLLTYTDVRLDQLAFRFGYEDAASLRDAFRRQTGVTPEHYRRHRTGSTEVAGRKTKRAVVWEQFR